MIRFYPETHEYYNDNKKLLSVTQLMRKHGLAPSYDGVPSEVLQRAAEKGTLVHKEIEDYIKKGEVGFTAELTAFKRYADTQENTSVYESEYILYNDIVAGTADLILIENGEFIIADIKTTSTLHKEAVSWQLSIYAELFNARVTDGNTITRGQVFHFDKDGELNVVEIPLKPVEEVKRLLDCERKGEIYTQTAVVEGMEDLPLQSLMVMETHLKRLDEEKKKTEARAQELRAEIMAAMEQNGVKSFENESIKLTYVEPTTRTSIDSTKLKAEMPEIAEKYTKTSQVKASLRITLKGE